MSLQLPEDMNGIASYFLIGSVSVILYTALKDTSKIAGLFLVSSYLIFISAVFLFGCLKHFPTPKLRQGAMIQSKEYKTHYWTFVIGMVVLLIGVLILLIQWILSVLPLK